MTQPRSWPSQSPVIRVTTQLAVPVNGELRRPRSGPQRPQLGPLIPCGLGPRRGGPAPPRRPRPGATTPPEARRHHAARGPAPPRRHVPAPPRRPRPGATTPPEARRHHAARGPAPPRRPRPGATTPPEARRHHAARGPAPPRRPRPGATTPPEARRHHATTPPRPGATAATHFVPSVTSSLTLDGCDCYHAVTTLALAPLEC